MARILPLYIIAGFIAVALTILVALILTQDAVAQTEQGSLACVDSNNNGRVDISELFDVIDAYFDGTRNHTPNTNTHAHHDAHAYTHAYSSHHDAHARTWKPK